MTIHQRLEPAARGRRAFVRLSIPIPPGASPRAALEAQAAFLIDLLDKLDPDPDLEDAGDHESYLAGHPGGPAYETDAEGDTADLEPSLGSLACLDQRRWNGGAADDRERDDSDDEQDAGNLLGAVVDPWCRLIVETAPDRQVRS